MDNFKNVPQSLYGLTPSQMDMFTTGDNHIHQMSERVTEVLTIYILLISSKWLLFIIAILPIYRLIIDWGVNFVKHWHYITACSTVQKCS